METLTQSQEATAADSYQTALYERTLSIVPEERFAAAREAIATSPDTWINLDSSEGVRELIEGTLDDDAVLNRALAEVGELEGDYRALLGQYLAETINEIIVEAEASYWLSSYRAERRPSVPAADAALAYEPNDPKHPGYLDRITA